MSIPVIFKTKDDTYRVAQKAQNQKTFKEGYAYLLSKFNRFIYPYRGSISSIKEAVEVGIYILNSKVFVKFPDTREETIVYDKNNVIQLSPDIIFKDLNDMIPDPYIDDESNSDGDVFRPPLKASDDIALAGMKYIIGEKGINFNQYSHKFSDANCFLTSCVRVQQCACKIPV